MKTLSATLLLFVYFQSFGQAFKLPEPDVEKIGKQMEDANYSDDLIQFYLENNFNSTTGRIDKKFEEWGNGPEICAFSLKFENDIFYTINQCGEGKGLSNSVRFPTTDMDLIWTWIEQIHKINQPSSSTNIWKKEAMLYAPEDDGAGCWYEIKLGDTSTTIEIYCGC